MKTHRSSTLSWSLFGTFAMSLGLVCSGEHAAFAQGAVTKPADKATAAKPAKTAAAPDTKKLTESALKKFKAEDFKGALADYEAAEAQKSTPDNIRQIAICQDKLGDLSSAVAGYEKFVAAAPAAMKAQADDAKKRADEIKAMPGRVHVESTPAGAALSLDGKAIANPTPTDLDVPAGKHELTVTLDGHDPVKRELDVAFASKQDLSVELPKKAEPAPPPPVAVAPPPPQPLTPVPPPAPRSKVPAYVTGGIAIVAAGVGTAFGIKALGDSSDFDKNPTTAKADSGENAALVADMCIGVAVTFGVTSLVLFFTNDTPDPAQKQARTPSHSAKAKAFTIVPTPVITSHGGGAGALVRF